MGRPTHLVMARHVRNTSKSKSNAVKSPPSGKTIAQGHSEPESLHRRALVGAGKIVAKLPARDLVSCRLLSPDVTRGPHPDPLPVRTGEKPVQARREAGMDPYRPRQLTALRSFETTLRVRRRSCQVGFQRLGAFCERSITLKTTANLSKCGGPWRTQTPGSTARFGGVQIVGSATTRMRDHLMLCRSRKPIEPAH